jgi:alanyl aminopeptidase
MASSRIWWLAGAVVFGLPPASTAADQPPKLRLSEVQQVVPTNYKVELTLDPAKDSFSGSVLIGINIEKPLQVIWLNQEKITVESAVLNVARRTFQARTLSAGDDFVGLQFDSQLPEGPAELAIRYSGVVVTDSPAAVFRRTDRGNAYLFSQFEATDARGAFPCFDEPSYKTPWQLTLRVPSQDSAVSNTGILSETIEGSTKRIVFRQTQPLPSYLIAFGVGPFEFVEAGMAGVNHIPVRIVVPRGHGSEAKWAAEITAELISRHEQYFGVPYPYDRADQVAVPEFPGAMENAGMVTYAQTLLLSSSESDTLSRQRVYAIVAAHELAHQWFGDLVTTAWWNDVWLNEAFATWRERDLIASWKPEWKTAVDDVSDKLRAERNDSLLSARKIRQPIESKDDISNAFDDITYMKGASVIAMFENWMGRQAFQKGIQSYVARYAFKTATADDFLEALGSAGDKDVARAFSTFLDQAGVPFLTVRLTCEPGAAPLLHLEQRRFLPLGSQGSTDRMWEIPVGLRYGRGETGQRDYRLLTQPAADWTLHTTECPAWVEANDNALGYYRVDYQGGLLHALMDGSVSTRLNAAERVDFMGNAEALSSAGKLEAADALRLVGTFRADPQTQVVRTALNLALWPRRHLVPDQLLPQYQLFVQQNFKAKAHELGWSAKRDEPDDLRLLRGELLRAVATWGGDLELGRQATDLAEKWLIDRHAVDPEILDAVLGTAGFYGDKALFDRFLREFKNSEDKQVREHLVAAMASFRDPAAITASLDALLAGEVPFSEGGGLIFSGQEEASTRRLASEYVKAHFDQIAAKMPSGGTFELGAFLPFVGGSFCDAASRAELETFFGPKIANFVGGRRNLQQVLEGIDLCTASKAAQQASVASFLRESAEKKTGRTSDR